MVRIGRLWSVVMLVLAVTAGSMCAAARGITLRPLMKGVPTMLSPLKGALGTESAAKDTKIDEFVNTGKGSASWSLIISFLVESVQSGGSAPVEIETGAVLTLAETAPIVTVRAGGRTGSPISVATPMERTWIQNLLQQHQSELGSARVSLVPCKNLSLAIVVIPVGEIGTRPVHTESVNYTWSAQLWDHVNASSWWQWYDTGYFWVKWLNPKLQGAKGTVTTQGEWRCVKTWDYETGIFDDNREQQRLTAEAYATQYGPELDTVPATGSLWGFPNTGKASWGGGTVNWSCAYEGIFTGHTHVVCRCVGRGGHGG